jgi:hypothetical protein
MKQKPKKQQLSADKPQGKATLAPVTCSAAPLQWTPIPPTIEGYYWWNFQDHKTTPSIIEIYRNLDKEMVWQSPNGRGFVRKGKHCWAGPIAPPAVKQNS